METKKREKMLLIGVAACVGIYLANLLLVTPLCASWSGRRDKINNLRNTIQKGRDTMASAQTITDRWNQMCTNTLSVNQTVAESQLFKAFQGWAVSNRVVLAAQKPQPKEADDPQADYSLEEWHADVTGSLEPIFNFLYAVESSPLGLKVDSIELSARDDYGRQLALGLTVSGLILNPQTNSVK